MKVLESFSLKGKTALLTAGAGLYGRQLCRAPGGYFNHQPEAFVRQYSANTMLGRLANDEDLKGLLVFLASDASAYITGTVIPADGGYTAK